MERDDMSKSQNQKPLVTSVSTRLRETINQVDTQAVTPDEIKTKKRNMLNIVDQSLNLYLKNLKTGKVDMSTSTDLERLVKLTLLLSGQADSVTGRPYGEQDQETVTTTSDLSISKIEEILNLDDPEVKSMFDKISEGYNKANDYDD